MANKLASEPWTFPCGHTYILPAPGVNNKEVQWQKRTDREQGGYHLCRLCRRKIMNNQRSKSFLSWAKYKVREVNRRAKVQGIVPPKISVDALVELREKSIYCAACKELLVWPGNGPVLGESGHHNHKDFPHLHHNHETGEVYGFFHSQCNLAEGYISGMPGGLNARINFVKNVFPELFAVIRGEQ